MGHTFHFIPIALSLGCALFCQSPAATLRVEGADPHLTTFLCARTASLRSALPSPLGNGMDAAFTVLGRLRVGDFAAAHDALDAARAAMVLPADDEVRPTDVAWLVVAHYWYLRASRDTAMIRERWPWLRAVAQRAAAAPGPSPATFVHEAMLVHCLFCLGGLQDTLDRIERPARWRSSAPSPRPGAEWTCAAVTRQIELERSAWQPGRGHFRAHLTAGTIALPERADVSLLAPAAAGLLVATSDRMLRHLRAVVADEQATTNCLHAFAEPFLPLTAALALSAATQLDDEAARSTFWSQLVELDPVAPRIETAVAGAQLDGACFALTGLRLATGAGLDEDWVRMRPWLPPHHDHLVLRGLHADGAHFELELSVRTGPLHDDEAGEPAIATCAASGSRLRVRLTLVATAGSTSRTVIVQGAGVQYLAEMRCGDVLERSLPRSDAEAQHESRRR